jgi:hypothetical protein
MRNPLNNIAMTRYKNLSRNSGVTAYAVTSDSIIVEFRDSPVYVYNHSIPGMRKVEAMKQLARKGRGLATYINKFVRKRYTAKLR